MLLDNAKNSWVVASSVRGAAIRAPQRPGVYAIGILRRVAGLPVEAHWVYVGRATGASGLSGRLRAHEPIREENDALRTWLMTPQESVEVWFSPTRSGLEAVELEAALIEALQPAFNTACNPARRAGQDNSRRKTIPAVA